MNTENVIINIIYALILIGTGYAVHSLFSFLERKKIVTFSNNGSDDCFQHKTNDHKEEFFYWFE